MKVCGIVAEYNPFHNGHVYQLKQIRENLNPDVIVVVMSGAFVQRGEPAILDKWLRAKCAVENGADLVIELPFEYAIQAAQGFAEGAIAILKQAGITHLCFGSEIGNSENLMDIAETPVNTDHLREMLDEGYGYPEAYSLLTSAMGPNDILGVSYLKQLKDSDITPFVIRRTNDYHDETLQEIASATAIRKAALNKEDTSKATPMDLAEPHDELSAYYPYIRTLLLTMKKADLANIFLFSEGIENHLVKCAEQCDDYDSFMNMATTRRYTSSRIRRCLVCLMMQYTKEDHKHCEAMIRPLAFNAKGQAYLKTLAKQEKQIASKFSQLSEHERKTAYKATVVYTLTMTKEKRTALLERELQGPFISR